MVVVDSRYFPLGWSDELKAVFDMMSVFNLDWFILSPECLLGMDYPHRVWMVTLGCGISAVYMWAYYALNRTLSPQSLSPFFYKEVISAYLLFLNWNYINLCVTTLQYFSCVHLNGWCAPVKFNHYFQSLIACSICTTIV